MKHSSEDTFSRTVRSLCDEIDYLKAELESVQEDAAHWRKEFARVQTESISSSQRMIGIMLTATMEGAIQPPNR